MAQSKNYNSNLLIVNHCLILKYTNPSPYYLFLISCPMYSYVLYYNVKKSGLKAVSASLVTNFFDLSLEWDVVHHFTSLDPLHKNVLFHVLKLSHLFWIRRTSK